MKAHKKTWELTVVCTFLTLLTLPQTIFPQSPGSFRSKETHGLGFGFEGGGFAGFYDFAISESFQLHIFGSSSSQSAGTLYDTSGATTTKTLSGVTLRIFPSSDSGFFFGGGGGGSSATQTVSQDIYCYIYSTSLNPSECSGYEGTNISKTTESTYTASATWGTLGWQGWDGYYFTIALMLGSDSGAQEVDNTGKVIDYANHKTTAKTQWENFQRNPSSLIISFAWHLF